MEVVDDVVHRFQIVESVMEHVLQLSAGLSRSVGIQRVGND